MHGNRRTTRGLSIGVVLCLVALVPVLGLSFMAWSSMSDARAAGRAAEHTERLAEESITLAELQVAVFDEMLWSSVDSVTAAVDAPTAAIESMVGLDPHAYATQLAARTDELAIAAGRSDLVVALESARAESDLSTSIAAYDEITQSMDAPLDALLAEATSAAIATQDGEALVHSIVALRQSVDIRSLTAAVFYSLVAAVFDIRDQPSVETARLIVLRAELDETLIGLRTNPVATPEILAAIESLRSDDLAMASSAVADTLVDERFRTATPPVGQALTLTNMIEQTSAFVPALRALTVSSEISLALIDSSVGQVRSSAASVQTSADREADSALRVAIALIVSSTAAASVAAWFVIRPLRRLRRAAELLQAGADLTEFDAIAGPSEVRSAGRAISQAAGHFDLVTLQARALANGALDASVLDDEVPGGLGAALQHAVGTLRAALAQQEEFRRRLAHEAAHDGLTSVANRNASVAQLGRSLARIQRSGGELAVLFIDLDQFKDINDTHGHPAGDAVLATVAQRLVNSVREGDHVGRMGGDEFLVIAEPVTGIDEAVSVAERVLAELTKPIELSGETVCVGASIGIAVTNGGDLSADELLRDADLAVYQAKGAGRGAVVICDEDLRAELAHTVDLTNAIRNAVDSGELTVFYQPIVDTATEELHAFEALVRWRRPGHEQLVPPDEFIPFAERSRLIIDVDCWVIDAVMRQAAAWKSHPRFGGVPISINVSGRHLADDAFVDHVLAPMARHDVDPHQFIIEITESALLDDLSGAATKLQRLRDRGVRVSIDDFGTGYTSLAHLRSLPIDVLKIDRSFTASAGSNPHEESIVKLIIDTGHLLGATVTAEGIETLDDVKMLSALGADTLQGYYYARPSSSEDITDCEASRATDVP